MSDRSGSYAYTDTEPNENRGHALPVGSAQDENSSVDSGEKNRSKLCNICSYTQKYPIPKIPIHHSHYSSVSLRELLSVETSGKEYFCPSCKCHHVPYKDERLKVAISDSTLHEFFAPRNHTTSVYEGDSIHVDYVTILNGTIPELLHAFRLDYESVPRPKPLDVLLVAGYTDLHEGFSREYIWRGFRYFADTVMKMKPPECSEAKNTFAISSLMYPPKLAWFSDDGPCPSNFVNMKEKIDWLNDKIDFLNIENNAEYYPCFHTYGVRKGSKLVTDENGQVKKRDFRCHRWDQWQEPIRHMKATLKAERIFKMGKAVNNYFIYRT